MREKEKHYIRDVQALRLIQEYTEKGIFPNEKIKSADLETVLMEIYCAEPRVFQTSNLQQSKMVVGLLNLLLATNQNEHILGLIENIAELNEEEVASIKKVL